MSPSRSARRQRETPIATATSAEARGDLAEADVDPHVHAGNSSRAGPCAVARPASIRTTQSARRRAWAGSWVTTTVAMSSLRAQLGQRGLDRVARVLVERRGRLVEQEHPRLERQGAREHHALLLADREPVGVAVARSRVRARPGRAAGPRRARGRRTTPRTRRSRPRCPRPGPGAAAPGRPRGAAREDRARERRRPGSGRSPRRGPRGGSGAAGSSTCPTPTGRPAPRRPRAATRSSSSQDAPPAAMAEVHALELEEHCHPPIIRGTWDGCARP